MSGASMLVSNAIRRFSGGARDEEKGEKEKGRVRIPRERDGLSLKDIQYPPHKIKT